MASPARIDRTTQSTRQQDEEALPIWRRIKIPRIPTFVWVLAGVIAALVGGLAAWRHFAIGSPRYTLQQVGIAFKNHDGTRLAYYLDVDGVTTQVADEGLDWLIATRRASALRALRANVHVSGSPRDSAARLQLLRDAMAQHGSHAVYDLLAGGTSDSANVAERLMGAFSAAPPLNVILGDEHLDLVRMGHAAHRGETLVVPVELHYRELDATVVVGVVLSQNGGSGRWRIVGVDKLDDLLAALDNAQLERLAAINRPIEEEMATVVQLGAPQVSRVAINRHESELRLIVPARNLSANPVSRVTVIVQRQGGDDEHSETLDAPLPIAPGATIGLSWSIPEVRRGSSSRLGSMMSHPDQLTVRPGLVQFDSSGQARTLQVFKSYIDARRAQRTAKGAAPAADSTDAADDSTANQ
jgi:hypothetical protein